jgi:oligosaccharyltransferase complex subunit gamma
MQEQRQRQKRSSSYLLILVLALAAVLLSLSVSSAQLTEDALAEKVARLQTKAARNGGIVGLDSKGFEGVLSKPRNYSMVILFTAMSPEFQCAPCK